MITCYPNHPVTYFRDQYKIETSQANKISHEQANEIMIPISGPVVETEWEDDNGDVGELVTNPDGFGVMIVIEKLEVLVENNDSLEKEAIQYKDAFDLSDSFDSPSLNDFIWLAHIDFLGVRCFYHPCLVDLINNVKIDLIWNGHLGL